MHARTRKGGHEQLQLLNGGIVKIIRGGIEGPLYSFGTEEISFGQGWRKEVSDGGLSLPTRGLKYGFQGTINAKNLRKVAFHLPTGG